jgi:NAD(P)-dependent dehydrogenase (short-subunit alcohol dehydrogenase family)
MCSAVLSGRRVVVTGAGMGLGAAYAEAAARAGAAVLVNDLDGELAEATATRIDAAGGRAVAFAGDVADWQAAGDIVERCIVELGGIDGLVNNAGIVGRLRPMFEETEDVARRVIDVNVLGTLFVGVHAARAMVKAGGGGTIVNVSSGNQCGHALLSTYGASKGAVSSLTYAWAADLAEYGIRVNAISPNAFTHQIEEVIEQLGYNPEDRRYPSPHDNAAVVTFLLSDASAKLNGQIIRVDSGRVSVMAHPMVVAPRMPLERVSVEALVAAFDDGLDAHLQPLGVATAEISHIQVLH